MITTQTELDYMQAAYQRAAADIRALEKKTTLTLSAGAASLTLPAEVVRIEAIFNGTGAVSQIPTVEYMRLASGSTVTLSDSTGQFFCVIARTVYFWPTVGVDTPLTFFYSYRPADLDSSASFALVGPAKRLLERLASGYSLLDDGQPELAQAELLSYQKDAKRLRSRLRGGEGTGGQLQLAGRRRAPS